MLDKIKEKIAALNPNQYRFDKSSNFITYNQWFIEKSNEIIVSVSNEIQLIEQFKNNSDSDIKQIVKDEWNKNDVVNGDYYREQYFQAVKELKRRNL